jgi:hypothetical protein
MTPDSEINDLQAALARLKTDTSGITAFANLARGQQALAQALPERFNEVLLNLLDRLESSALFTEESCSFSHAGLLESLQMWIDKAQLQLQKSAA